MSVDEVLGQSEGASERGRVLAAMSGGVDSSVMALLLAEAGYDVTGVTMQLIDNALIGADADSSCCSLEDVEDARAVCRRIGIRHYTFNDRDRFREEVVERFCASYLSGETPNPCIECNRALKFEGLQRRRRELGADYVATGHYARRVFDAESGRWKLMRARDSRKDQSYVLHHLTQDHLAHMLFPLGDYTKDEVRAIAAEHGFVNARKRDSQDICFIPDGDYVDFIGRYTGEASQALFEPGAIVDREGVVLGRHRGLIHYTIGQRKGIGIANREPLYVFDKSVEANELVVAPLDEMMVDEVMVREFSMISGDSESGTHEVAVKTSYRERPVAAELTLMADGEARVRFREPHGRPAAGQSLVAYVGDEVLGGGIIAR